MLPDTSNVKSFELKNPAWYKVRFVAGDEQSQDGIATMVILKFAYHDNSEIWDRCAYGEKALWKLKAFKSAMGLADTDRDWKTVLGDEVYVKVTIEEWKNDKGEKRENNKIQRYMSVEKYESTIGVKEKKVIPADDDSTLPF
jgi:hypothetical protein